MMKYGRRMLKYCVGVEVVDPLPKEALDFVTEGVRHKLFVAGDGYEKVRQAWGKGRDLVQRMLDANEREIKNIRPNFLFFNNQNQRRVALLARRDTLEHLLEYLSYNHRAVPVTPAGELATPE